MGLLIQSSVSDHQRVKKQRVVDNVHVDAADDAIDFGFFIDSDEQDLNEITREDDVAKPGFKFVPSDEDLVTYLREKVYGGGEARSDRVLLGECDMYGDKEPWNIWNDHGGSKLSMKDGEDLYFFTKLKKVSDVNGSRNYKRRVGSGTWSGAYCRDVAGGVAKKRHFSYENEGCSAHHHAWIMHEYRLVDLTADYVLCRLRKKPKKVDINNKNNTLRKKPNKDMNNKNTGLVNNNQANNLVLDYDQEIIKKQRLGVESECDDQVLEKILPIFSAHNMLIPVCSAQNMILEEGTKKFVEIDDILSDHVINNISKSSSTSTTAVQGHGDQIIISEDDKDASLKSLFKELEELEKIMPPSYSTLDMFWEEKVMKVVVMDTDNQATNDHGTAGADYHSQLDVDYGTKVEDDDDADYLSGKKSFVELLNDSHMEVAEEHGNSANNNVVRSTSGADCGEQDLKEISREECINAAAASVANKSPSSANNNVAKSTSGAARLSYLDVDFEGVVDEDVDDEYLNGKKSSDQLLKDIPIYYVETHDDQDDMLLDIVVDL